MAAIVVCAANSSQRKGRKEPLSRLGASRNPQRKLQANASCTEVFRKLKERGLSGAKLVVPDAHSGLVAAER